LFPIPTSLQEITYTNRNNNVDFDLKFYKNGTTPGDLFYTYSVTNGSPFGYTLGLNFSFAPGDYIRIKYKDQGRNTSDLALVLWMVGTL